MGKSMQRFVLLCLICAVSAFPGSAAARGTTEGKAEALHELYILKGDPSGFQLQSRVERSDAAVFAVRLAGAEQEALQLKGNAPEIKFIDVAEDDWFAPYIVYAVKAGFISGYADNTFRAEEYINEKQFIKMMLGVLGYQQDVDYEWKDVYRKAAEIGLIEGEPLSENGQDFTREGVVKYLYRALQLTPKQSNKTLIEELAERGVVPADTASAFGLLPAPKQEGLANPDRE